MIKIMTKLHQHNTEESIGIQNNNTGAGNQFNNNSSGSQNNTINEIASDIEKSYDLVELASQLSTLREAMRTRSTEEDHDIAVGNVASAVKAAKEKNIPDVIKYLKAAGSWAYNIAEKLSIPIAIEIIKKALNL